MANKKRSASQQTTGGKKAKKAPELSLAPTKSRGDDDFSQSQNPASSAVSENDAQISDFNAGNYPEQSLKEFINNSSQVYNNIDIFT
jgi:hypothetical protein